MRHIFYRIPCLFLISVLVSCEKMPMIGTGPSVGDNDSTRIINHVGDLIQETPSFIGYTQYPGIQDSVAFFHCWIEFDADEQGPYCAKMMFELDIMHGGDYRALYPAMYTNEVLYDCDLEELDIFHPIDKSRLISLRRDPETGLLTVDCQLTGLIEELLSEWVVPKEQEIHCTLPNEESLEQIIYGEGVYLPLGNLQIRDDIYLPNAAIAFTFQKTELQVYHCQMAVKFTISEFLRIKFYAVDIDTTTNKIHCYRYPLDKSTPDLVFTYHPNTSKVVVDWTPGEYVKQWCDGRIPVTDEKIHIRLSPNYEYYCPDIGLDDQDRFM